MKPRKTCFKRVREYTNTTIHAPGIVYYGRVGKTGMATPKQILVSVKFTYKAFASSARLEIQKQHLISIPTLVTADTTTSNAVKTFGLCLFLLQKNIKIFLHSAGCVVVYTSTTSFMLAVYSREIRFFHNKNSCGYKSYLCCVLFCYSETFLSYKTRIS